MQTNSVSVWTRFFNGGRKVIGKGAYKVLPAEMVVPKAFTSRPGVLGDWAYQK